MFKSFLLSSIRSLYRHKWHSLINILGLAIGIACCFLIILYVQDELSYDRHFPNAENIYRVAVRGIVGDQEINGVQTSSQMARTLVDEYPEVLNATRLHHTPNMLVRYSEKVFNETRFMWVDTNFFEIFQIPVLYGDPKTALQHDHTLVLTLSTARRYFDDPAAAIGKVVTFEDETPYTISGIVADAHPNAHFHYDMLCPLSSWNWNHDEWWLNNFMYTYLTLHPEAEPEALEDKFPAFIEKYIAAQLQRATGMSLKEFYGSGGALDFFLQPLTQIHLHSHLDGELEPNSDSRYIYIFSIIAVFILSIACINYMNIATARSAGRGKEVGMRKVLGSTRNRLLLQFLTESVMLTTIAMLIALLLVHLLLPQFNQIANKTIQIAYFGSWYILPGILMFTLLVGLLAGSYPAFFLASFRPVEVLKGTFSTGLKGRRLRSTLVVFQFVISAVLFVATFVIFTQMRYIQNKRLGFQKENIVVIKRGWAIGQNPDGSLIEPEGNEPAVIDLFKNDLLQNPQILSAAGSTQLPGEDFPNAVFVPFGTSGSEQHPINYMLADFDFAETFEIELVEGRWFSREFGDWQGVIINEAAARALGFQKPYIENYIGFPGNSEDQISIVGVIRDFHYESLHKPIEPLLIDLRHLYRTYLSVRIRPEEFSRTLEYIEKVWYDYIPYKPFEFYFFDEAYARLYRAEKQTGQLFTIFSILAIFVACMGLFGMASFTTERRIKEIGIRKTLGASVPKIIILLTTEFLKWVLVANLIAWPLAYFAMRGWLTQFAYRTAIHWWIFPAALFLSLCIALATVSYQSIRASLRNPADTLKYE